MADRTALARATEGTDAPTPGYLYLDIAKSVASSPTAAQETSTYLTRRLSSKNSPSIKFKCLKVIAMTAQSPVTRGQFKRVVSLDPTAVAAIKEALTFRGPPDPVRGDEIYARVRNAAKDALDAVYSDTPSSDPTAMSATTAAYGSAPFAGGQLSSVSSTGPRKMEGIGNPMFRDPRNSSSEKGIGEMTIGEVFGAAKEGFVGIIKDPLAKSIASSRGFGTDHRSNSWSAPPGQSHLAHATGGQWTMASNRGPNSITVPYNSDQDSEYYKTRDSGSNTFQWAQQQGVSAATAAAVKSVASSGVGGSWASKPSVASQARVAAHGSFAPPPTNTGAIGGSGGTAAADGSYERNLVMELCPPGGMRAEPPHDKLEAFALAIPSLNPDLVCPALLDALEDGQPWIIRAKALCVMEVTITIAEQNKEEGGNNAYADFFHACAGEIEPLASHARAAIRDPAKRVLKALGLDHSTVPQENTTESGKNTAPATAAPPAPLNLLDFGDVDAPPPVPSVPPPAAPPHGDSMFGGMNVKSMPAAAAASLSPPSEEFECIFGVTSEESKDNKSLFGDMAVKCLSSANDGTAIETELPLSPVGESAFSFLNNGEKSNSENTLKPVPDKASFDPLLSLASSNSPQSSSKTPIMAMNSQMQAMAYQQNMRMMQMHLQQMQMGGSGRNVMMYQQNAIVPNIVGKQTSVIMGGSNSGGVSTSFAFMEDPNKAKKEKMNATFDFVKDAMKGAK